MTNAEIETLIAESLAAADHHINRSDKAVTLEAMESATALANLALAVVKLGKHCIELGEKREPWWRRVWGFTTNK